MRVLNDEAPVGISVPGQRRRDTKHRLFNAALNCRRTGISLSKRSGGAWKPRQAARLHRGRQACPIRNVEGRSSNWRSVLPGRPTRAPPMHWPTISVRFPAGQQRCAATG